MSHPAMVCSRASAPPPRTTWNNLCPSRLLVQWPAGMEAVVAGRKLRLFGRMIQCCNRIGDDLFVEALPDRVVFRSLNSARSAFVAFKFSSSFFDRYRTLGGVGDEAKCRVNMKTCTAAFRPAAQGERAVESLLLRLDPERNRFVFEFQCKFNIVKTFSLPYEDSENLQAVFERASACCVLSCRPRILADALSTFAGKAEEITISVMDDSVQLKSFYDTNKEDALKLMHTTSTIPVQDLESFQCSRFPLLVTCCLREFRALVSFCEAAAQPVQVYLNRAGMPILFATRMAGEFEVDFVLATLQSEDDDVDGDDDAMPQQHASHHSAPQHVTQPQDHAGLQRRTQSSQVPASRHAMASSQASDSVNGRMNPSQGGGVRTRIPSHPTFPAGFRAAASTPTSHLSLSGTPSSQAARYAGQPVRSQAFQAHRQSAAIADASAADGDAVMTNAPASDDHDDDDDIVLGTPPESLPAAKRQRTSPLQPAHAIVANSDPGEESDNSVPNSYDGR